MSKLGLYVHIPFCQQKCLYCDFASFAQAEHQFVDYTAALCQQIADQGGMLCKPAVDTVYIGGGTPSILPIELVEKILLNLCEHFTVEPGAEISMEANPGTVTKEQLTRLRQAGVNRISFGVQSFNDTLLVRLGRIHSVNDSLSALEYAAAAGFDNISIDLMYGLPGQTLAGFTKELEQAVALPISHISVYGLKLEAGTPLAAAYDQGLVVLPDEVEEESMYDAMSAFLPTQGLVRYEISNFARKGKACRHNLKYWHYEPYLGLGSAAHSFLQGERISSETDVTKYIKAVVAGDSPVVMREKLTSREAMAEYIFLALRTTQGMSLAEFHCRFAIDFFSQFGEIFNKLKQQRLIEADSKWVRLTEYGMKFGNIVFAAFLPD